MNKYLLGAICIIVIAVGVAVFLPHKTQAPAPSINSFDDCVKAGGTVSGNTCTAPSGACCFQQSPQANPDVIVDTPQPNDLVTSPLTVKGRARGNWYFEANLPVKLKDGNGAVIAQKGFHSIGDWMTTNLVDFNDTLTFTTPTTQYGTLVISKDNPSGEPANDADFVVPIRFR